MDPEDPSVRRVPEAEQAALRARVATLEERLAQAERLIDALLTEAPLAVQLYDAAGTALRLNERCQALRELCDAQEAPAGPDAPASGAEAFRRAAAGELVRLPARPISPRAGERRGLWIRETLAPVRGPGGLVEAVLLFVEELAAGPEAPEARPPAAEIWEAFFEHSPLALQIYGRDGTSLRMNEANRRLLGLPDASYGVGAFNALTDPFMVDYGHAAIYARAYAGELVELPEFSTDFDAPTNRWATGRHVAHYSQVLVPIPDEAGGVAAVVSCAVDITARKEAERAVQRQNAGLEALVAERTAALRESVARLEHEVAERRQVEVTLRASEERYRALVEASPDLLLRFSRAGVYLDVHAPRAEHLIAPTEQLLGRRLEEVLPPELAAGLRERITRALETGELQVIEYDLQLPSARRWYEAWIVRSGADEAFASIREITTRRQAEEARLQVERRLQEAQRLESLAVLAGGIAHDFNNILTAVIGHAELALSEPISPGTEAHLAAIGAGARRAADLTGQILAYAGRGRVQSQLVGLGGLVQELRSLAATVVGLRGELHYRLADDAVSVSGDAGQLRQLVLNLIANAAEALGPAGGAISVETAAEELSLARLERLTLGAGAAPGQYVRLSVRDTGTGMDVATLGRIFDPFFTTKFAGRGLGLAAVHGIVRGHNGALEVLSAPGQGTVFNVWLPAAQGAAPAGRAAAAGRRSGNTLLVVDDEEGVRLILRRLLEREGYVVLAAPDGGAAIALLEAGLPDLGGVLLDLTMPGVTSEAVAAALRASYPEVPLLLISGYSREELAERQRALGAQGWLQKPFSGDALRALVARCIGRAGAG